MYNWQLLNKQLSLLLDNICSKSEECGCQLTIFHHGEMVVDIASGVTASVQGRPVAPDDLFPLFSCGKAILATAVLQGVERGSFALDTPLAEFWPAFAVKEKCGITVEHVLSHRAGMYILPKVDCEEDFADWDAMCARTAALVPRNAPGKKCVYQPL